MTRLTSRQLGTMLSLFRCHARVWDKPSETKTYRALERRGLAIEVRTDSASVVEFDLTKAGRARVRAALGIPERASKLRDVLAKIDGALR